MLRRGDRLLSCQAIWQVWYRDILCICQTRGRCASPQTLLLGCCSVVYAPNLHECGPPMRWIPGILPPASTGLRRCEQPPDCPIHPQSSPSLLTSMLIRSCMDLCAPCIECQGVTCRAWRVRESPHAPTCSCVSSHVISTLAFQTNRRLHLYPLAIEKAAFRECAQELRPVSQCPRMGQNRPRDATDRIATLISKNSVG